MKDLQGTRIFVGDAKSQAYIEKVEADNRRLRVLVEKLLRQAQRQKFLYEHEEPRVTLH